MSTDTPEPTELTTLRTQKVKYISCGETHSAALTEVHDVMCGSSGVCTGCKCSSEKLTLSPGSPVIFDLCKGQLLHVLGREPMDEGSDELHYYFPKVYMQY